MKSLYRVISISQEGKVYMSYVVTEDIDKIVKAYRNNGHDPRCTQYCKQASNEEPIGIVDSFFEFVANNWKAYTKIKMKKSLKYWSVVAIEEE